MDDVQPLTRMSDIEDLIDNVLSWWDDEEMSWMGSAEDIKQGILEDLPGHKVEVSLSDRSVYYQVMGPIVNVSCSHTIEEDGSFA